MFWLQMGVSFFIWIGGGFYLARKRQEVSAFATKLSRAGRILSAAGMMLICLAVLFIPLDFLELRGEFQSGPMSVGVWSLVTICGGVFVTINSVAMNILISVAREGDVTDSSPASSTQESS